MAMGLDPAAATAVSSVLFDPRSRIYRLILFLATAPCTSRRTEFGFSNAKSSRQAADPKINTGRSPHGDRSGHRTVRHDASVEPRAWFDFGARAGGGAPMGNGAVAFAAGTAAVLWQPEHPRGNRAADIVSAPALLHACVGSHPNSARPGDSLSVARPHHKYAGHAHSYRNRHRLYLRDCQSLGRSLDTVSTNRARVVGVGTFCRRFAFLVAALRLVSGGVLR